MQTSKTAHFDFLQSLEDKYAERGSPSLAENTRLKHLLDNHDRCVRRFRELIQELRHSDLAAYEALVAQLTLSNAPAGHA